MSLIKPLAKMAAWFAGRFGGQAEADKVNAAVQARIQSEIDAKKPLLLNLVDGAVVVLDAAATLTIEAVRTKIIATMPNANLSSDAQARVVGAINTVAAPTALNGLEATIAAFAADVKAAISKL